MILDRNWMGRIVGREVHLNAGMIVHLNVD